MSKRRALLEFDPGASILRICILASSSAGNSVFIGNGHTRILVDAGISGKDICQRLEAIGERVEALDAVLVTHEHGDHICGLIPVLKKSKAVVYLTRLTAPMIDWGKFQPALRTFQAGECFSIGDLQVRSFTIPHDAIDPVGFTVACGSLKAGIVTDLGYMPDSVRYHLQGCEFLLLESNHAIEMLKVGPYPWSVKQRVMGRNGHLSNEHVADFILDGMDPSVRTLVLGHLSECNNHPAVAEMCAAGALARRATATKLCVAEPRATSIIWEY